MLQHQNVGKPLLSFVKLFRLIPPNGILGNSYSPERVRKKPYTGLENYMMASTACSAVYMNAAGLSAAIPALYMIMPDVQFTYSHETGALSPVSSMSFPGRAREVGC